MALTKIGIDAISGAIGTANLEDGAVTSAKIANSTIAAADIASGVITPTAVSNQANSSTGYFDVPAGTTAQRPASPATGMVRYNTDNNCLEQYTPSGWVGIAAPPTISSVSPSTFNGESGTSFTINGSSFDGGVIVKFITAGGEEVSSATVSYVNNSELTATTARDFTVAEEPLKVKVINSTGLTYTLENAIDCGGTPTWSSPTAGALFSQNIYEGELAIATKTFSATDPDTSATVSYSVSSGALPSGSVNSSTGVYTPGTFPTVASDTTYNFTMLATDNAGNSTTRAFTAAIKNDPSLDYTANLRIWLRGGYNGASAGGITAGNDVITAARWGSSTGTINSVGTVTRTNSSITNSPGNSSTGRYIKDSAGGATAVLQDDKLQFGCDPDDYFWQTMPSNNSVFDASTPNATFAYWLMFENRSEVTGSSNLYPTFHMWSTMGGANAIIAHDWWTGGTGDIYITYYRNSANAGNFTPTGIGGTNGGKGVWFHFAITHTASVTKTYVNGVEQANTLTSYNTWPSIGASQGINFSGRCDGVSSGACVNGTTGTGFKSFADMRYYNATLPAEAIAAIYAKTRSSFA
jgi:hypothetical protein